MKRKLSIGAKVGCNRYKTESCAARRGGHSIRRCRSEERLRKVTPESVSDGRCANEEGMCVDGQRVCRTETG